MLLLGSSVDQMCMHKIADGSLKAGVALASGYRATNPNYEILHEQPCRDGQLAVWLILSPSLNEYKRKEDYTHTYISQPHSCEQYNTNII